MIVCVFIKYVIMLKIIQKMSSKIWLRNIFYYWLFKGTVTWHLGTGGDRWIDGMGGVSKVSGRKHLVGKSKLFKAGDLLKFSFGVRISPHNKEILVQVKNEVLVYVIIIDFAQVHTH